jgi:hypothetical protein
MNDALFLIATEIIGEKIPRASDFYRRDALKWRMD